MFGGVRQLLLDNVGAGALAGGGGSADTRRSGPRGGSGHHLYKLEGVSERERESSSLITLGREPWRAVDGRRTPAALVPGAAEPVIIYTQNTD